LDFELHLGAELPRPARIAEIISDNLQQLGIRIRPNVKAQRRVEQLVFEEANFDMYLMGNNYWPDPDFLFFEWFSDPPIPSWNAEAEGYVNPELNAVLLAQRQTVDPAQRLELAQQAQRILAEDLPVVVTLHSGAIQAFRMDRFEGWDLQEGIYSTRTTRNIRGRSLPETSPRSQTEDGR